MEIIATHSRNQMLHFNFQYKIAGLSQTGCTLVRRNEKATEEGFAVESLKLAGAIPLCVTNTPEICTGFDSSNLLYGTTNNPYDTRYIAGGSSGGEVRFKKYINIILITVKPIRLHFGSFTIGISGFLGK